MVKDYINLYLTTVFQDHFKNEIFFSFIPII